MDEENFNTEKLAYGRISIIFNPQSTNNVILATDKLDVWLLGGGGVNTQTLKKINTARLFSKH